jgi:hypothetical protein
LKKGKSKLRQARGSNTSVKVKHNHNSLININPLINYLLMATKNQLLISESRSDSNRWTPCRGNLIHTTHTLLTPVHVCHSYASFHESSTMLGRVTTPDKKEFPTTSPAHRLIDLWVPIQFLSPSQPLKQWRKPNICWQQATSVYCAHISSM